MLLRGLCMLIQSSPLQSMPLVLLTLLLYWVVRVASLILAREVRLLPLVTLVALRSSELDLRCGSYRDTYRRPRSLEGAERRPLLNCATRRDSKRPSALRIIVLRLPHHHDREALQRADGRPGGARAEENVA